MIERSTNPGKFAAWFNSVVTGAYRKITTQDIRDMETCGLIRRYGGYYHRMDLETARGILQYEYMRKKGPAKSSNDNKQEPPKCKMCEQPLSPEPENMRGRPREYCPSCESSRNRERYRRWRKRKKRHECSAL